MPKLLEGQSTDYAAILDAGKGPSPYPPDACTPPKRGRGRPSGVPVTIDGECSYICR
jgi:hypothetical protein